MPAKTLRLHLDDVTFGYRGRTVLDGVTTVFEPGVTALVGANGAGKTTLLRLVAGVLVPDSGAIRLPPAQDGPAVVGVGYLPQSPRPSSLLTARAYVEYFAYLCGVRSAAVPAAAESALSAVDMLDRAGTRTSKLSGGMFRRVSIAAALVGEPQVLLLDEPTTGLDPVQRIEVRKLAKLLARKRVVVLATHLLEDVAAIADSVVVLNGTHVVFDGTPADLAASAAPRVVAEITPSLEGALLALVEQGPTELGDAR